MEEGNLNLYKPIDNLSLIDRAKEIYLNLKLISEFLEIETWYDVYDKSRFDINDSNGFVNKVLKEFSRNIREFTVSRTIDYNIKPLFSNNYSVFGSDKLDEGPVIMQIISKEEAELVILKYKELVKSDAIAAELIELLKSEKGFILDTNFD